MLGLGSSITTGGAIIAPSIKATFTSDFTSDVDGWLAFSIQNSSSDLTLAANTNPYDDLGGSAPNSDGWLRGTYGVTQTNINGVHRNGWITGYTKERGDYVVLSLKLYIVNDSGKWGGSDDVEVLITTPPSNPNSSQDVPLDTETTLNYTSNPDADGVYAQTSIQVLTQTAGDLPQVGAVFYIKDVVVQVWN